MFLRTKLSKKWRWKTSIFFKKFITHLSNNAKESNIDFINYELLFNVQLRSSAYVAINFYRKNNKIEEANKSHM